MKKLYKIILKKAYKKYVYPELLKYVQKTDNDYDDKALAFINDLIDVLFLKADKTIDEVEKALQSEM